MYEIRVEAGFAAAHFLTDYHGKCERLHGHNYQVYAHFRGQELDSGGMLIDFGEAKKALRQVCDSLDHSNLNDLAVFAQNPSAERIAQYLFEQMTALFTQAGAHKAREYLLAVDVFETSGSRARYRPGRD
jgi:6-pyruvoyltetrahydropterin/6-carboxytetrahydropterin synthase